MRTKHILASLAVAVVAAAACEDITNPVEEIGTQTPGWVGFEAPRAVNGPHGTWTSVRYGGIALRPEEDVTVTLEFGGTAVFGEDYIVVQDSGSTAAASGFDASGGTDVVEYDPLEDASVDTLWLYVPTTATVGAVVEVALTEATTASGDSIGAGYLGSFDLFEMQVVRQPTDIPTGTYAGSVTGDFGSGGIPDVAITEGPVTVGGTSYDYEISDFAYGLFGEDIPWAFTVFVDGSVAFSPENPGGGVTANTSGSYDFETSTLTMNVELTCCGASGATWTAVYTLQ